MLGATFGLFALFCVVLIVSEDVIGFLRARLAKLTKKMQDEDEEEYEVGTDYVLFQEDTELADRPKQKPKNLNSYIRAEVKRGGFKKAENFDLRVVDPEFYSSDTLKRVYSRRQRRRHAIFVPPPPSHYYTTFEENSDDSDEELDHFNKEVEKIVRTTSILTDQSTTNSFELHGSEIWE